VVVVDAGVAKNLSTSSLKDDAYAFIFSQQGLMVGVSIEGRKTPESTGKAEPA
jgi:lipid-binding SYLF domain-containing protein